MFDPVTITTALGVASSAMSQIKKMYDHGKDISEMSGAIGKWMGAYAEVDALEKEAKNPSLLRKITSGKSIEEVALQASEELAGVPRSSRFAETVLQKRAYSNETCRKESNTVPILECRLPIL